MLQSVVIIIISSLVIVSSDEDIRSLFTLKKGCELLGHPHATVNKCGYCVGSDTHLPDDFGTDCRGRCSSHDGYDCAGNCYGDHFQDECTNTCVNATHTKGRDCRGLCTNELSPEILLFQYKRDKCNMCRLASDAGSESPAIDCTGKCVAPGVARSKIICNKCTDSQVDTCAICPNSTCSCDRNVNACGCNDAMSCYSVMSISPKFLPVKLPRTVTLSGYFAPVSKDLQCVFKHQVTSTVVVTQINFNENNRTSVTCNIALPKLGLWTLGLRTSRQVKNLHIDEDIVLYAFDKNIVTFTSLTPSKLILSQMKEVVTFKVKANSPENTPNIPLVCRICSLKTSSTWEIVSDAGSSVHSCDVKPSKELQTSQELTVSFTFDGHEVLSPVFRVKVVAPVPSVNVRTSFISSDGLAIVVTFDCPVDTSDFTTDSSVSLCRQMLSLRGAPLDLASCVWATRDQFVIHLKKPLLESTVEVKFNPGVLKQFNQQIRLVNEDEVTVVLSKLTSEWFLYSPRLLITGPDEVPTCGVFILSSYLSAPQASWGAVYEWSLLQGDLSLDAYTQVNQYVSLVSLSENLILPSELLTHGYQFTFKLVVKLIDGTNVQATHSVTRYPVESPIVSIYSTSMLPVSPITLDQSVSLIAHVTIPHCVGIVQQIYLTWFVDDIRVRFNFTHPYYPVYRVSPFDLAYVPPEINLTYHEVTFGVATFFGHRQVNATKGYFKIQSLDAQYNAVINDGAIAITTATSAGGTLDLTASGHYFGEDVRYQWSCSDAEQTPCFDHSAGGDGENGYLLVDSKRQSARVMSIDTASLPPNRDLFFALKIFQANHHPNKSRVVSETELISVKTVAGNAPQVTIGPILINNDIRATIRSPHNLAFLVPEHTNIKIKGRVMFNVGNIKSVAWECDKLTSPVTSSHYYDGSLVTISELVIPAQYVHAYAVHNVKLRSCSWSDECSETSTQFTVTPSVTGCYVLVDPYTELTFPVKLEVVGCNIPPGLAPITFQIFASDSIEVRPLSPATFDRVFFLPGVPGVTSSSVTFIARVCDILNNCHNFESNSVDIEDNFNVTASAGDIITLVKKFATAGGHAEAVSYLIPLLLVNGNDRLVKYSDVISDVVKLIVEYTVDSLDRLTYVFTTGHTAVYLRALNEAIRVTDDATILSKLLAAVRKIALRSRGMKVKLDVNQVDSLVQTIVNRFNTADDKLADAEEEAQLAIASLYSSIASSITIGERLQLGQFVQLGPATSKGNLVPPCYTVIVHDSHLQDMTLSTHLDAMNEISVGVTFGKDITNDFAPPWNCEGRHCNSIVFAVTVFPHGGPFHSKHRHSHLTRITPVVSVKLFSPVTGKEQPVQGYLSAVSLTFSLTGNASHGGDKYDSKCLYWNRLSQSWEADGVHLLTPVNITNGNITCWSGHLTEFAVFRVRQSIAGLVTGIAMFTLLAAIVVTFICACFKRQDTQTSKLDESTIRL